MPDTITFNINDFLRMADTAPDKNVIVKDGGFKSVGKLGSFFATKTQCRLAADVLIEGIRSKYGDAVADTLAADLRTLRSGGKPLNLRTARDLLTRASDISRGLGQVNADLAQHFITGSGIKGDTRNLDSAMADFFAANGISRDDTVFAKPFFEKLVKTLAAGSDHLMSYAELAEAVRGADPGMVRDFIGVERFKTGPGMTAAVDTLAAKHGMTPEQKVILAKVTDMAVELAERSGKPLTAESLSKAIQDGTLRGIDSLLYAFELAEDKIPSERKMMGFASNSPQLADAAMLAAVLEKPIAGPGLWALQKLPEMRVLQPEGAFTRDTIWQACYNEPMPQALRDANTFGFNKSMADRLDEIFKNVNPDPKAVGRGITLFTSGVKLEKALEYMKGPISIGMDDFLSPPVLTHLTQLKPLESVENQVAVDIHRRGTHNRIEGYDPVISFTGTDGQTETIHIRDTSNLNDDDKKKFLAGIPNPISHALVGKAQAMCQGNDAQLRQVVLSMSQAGTFLMRSVGYATGVDLDEHSPIDISIRKEENGSISMRFKTPDASPANLDYTYTVAPDGRGVLAACTMQKR